MASRGQEIHVITGCQLYGDPYAALSAEESIRGVQVHRVPTSRFGRTHLLGRAADYLTFYLGATWRLLRLVDRGDVVVAKTDPPMMSVLASWVVMLRRGVLVNWVQDVFPEVATALDVCGLRYAAPMLKRLRNQSLRASRLNVVLGDVMAERLRDEGIPADQIAIIENWADGEVIRPVRRQDNPLLHEWGLDDKFVLGYSGNMGRVHEFKTMIDAAERLRGVDDIAFVFIGDGVARRWIESEAAGRGLTNVQVYPYQSADRLQWSLSVPDVHFVSLRPALEGLIVPSKFYGIAAAGRPIIHIGDPDGQIARILDRERCGWSVGIGDVDALAACILRLFHRRKEVIDAGCCARLAFDRKYARVYALDRWRALLKAASTDPVSVNVAAAVEQPVGGERP